jgi:DNA-binding winged helix-turn-helix (wHTH) protein
MSQTAFYINSRFIVNRDSSEIVDSKNQQSIRLEPRLLRLLCLLADNPGQLVSRERIIKEIWDDYPGASDGLNQGISFLRKQLDDEQKTMIRTLPKAGYSFHGKISMKGENPSEYKRQYNWWRVAAAGCGVLVAVLLIALYTKTNRGTNGISEEALKEAVRISRHDSIHQAETMRKQEGR